MSVKHNKKTCLKSNDVKKQLIQLRANLEADIKAKLKAAKLIVFDDLNWKHPSECALGLLSNVEHYLAERCLSIDKWTISCIANDPTLFSFATAEEVNDFKTKVWPKLKAKYEAERAAVREDKRAENAKDIGKLKAKIAKLQVQLEELEG